MTNVTHPDKRLVRDYMERRQQSRTPPPSPEAIRRELGWDLIPQNKAKT